MLFSQADCFICNFFSLYFVILRRFPDDIQTNDADSKKTWKKLADPYLKFEPRSEKTGYLHMRKQSRRSVVR